MSSWEERMSARARSRSGPHPLEWFRSEMPEARYAEGLHEEEIRLALLQRLADGMTLISAPRTHWTCCWLSYEHVSAWHGSVQWQYSICSPTAPGAFSGYQPCGHWHHQHEIFLA